MKSFKNMIALSMLSTSYVLAKEVTYKDGYTVYKTTEELERETQEQLVEIQSNLSKTRMDGYMYTRKN